jgi:hypothetical protein
MQFKLTLTSYRDGETFKATYPTRDAVEVASSVIETMMPGRFRMDVETCISAGHYILSRSTVEAIRAIKETRCASPVTCIKMIREISGAGLKEAKDAYDAI